MSSLSALLGEVSREAQSGDGPLGRVLASDPPPPAPVPEPVAPPTADPTAGPDGPAAGTAPVIPVTQQPLPPPTPAQLDPFAAPGVSVPRGGGTDPFAGAPGAGGGGPRGTQYASNTPPGTMTDVGGGSAGGATFDELAQSAARAGVKLLQDGWVQLSESSVVRGTLVAAPELGGWAVVVGGAVALAANGQVSAVPVAGYDGAAGSGVAPVSAEVDGARGTVLLYQGATTAAPDLYNQHTVQLSLGTDGGLRDGQGNLVGRLDGGRVVPSQGVSIPGLFSSPVATQPLGPGLGTPKDAYDSTGTSSSGAQSGTGSVNQSTSGSGGKASPPPLVNPSDQTGSPTGPDWDPTQPPQRQDPRAGEKLDNALSEPHRVCRRLVSLSHAAMVRLSICS